MGLGEFVMSVGGVIANFIGVFGILPIVEVRQKPVKTLHNTTYFTLSRFW
jgi:hypothetical protein